MKQFARLLVTMVTGIILGGCATTQQKSGSSAQAQTLTYPDLVRQLTDLERLATAPPLGERGGQASSYDRASQYDAVHDRYLNWGANHDGDGIIRQEGNISVLAEINGPGCIRRIWSARAGAGHVRIYLDGAAKPAVDMPFMGYFNHRNAPFNRRHLVYAASSGLNNYTPIPFQKSCRIVAEKGWGSYYHFTYTQFPAGTVVPTFSRVLSKEDNEALDAANSVLGQCGQDPAGPRPGERTLSEDAIVMPRSGHAMLTVDGPPPVIVSPGAHDIAVEIDGPGAITALKVHLYLPKDIEAQRRLLRQLTLAITWDDDAEPAVWAPLGDFFASPAGAVPFQSLPVGLTKDGTFYCYWYMPFATKARIMLGNDGPAPVDIELKVVHAPLDKPLDSLLRFHAKWHRDAFLPKRADRFPDWTILTTRGRGRFVGVALHVWNPRGGWWGEGDEKFFVDGEKFPSTFGTGSEDYFGFAWSNPCPFVRPFHDQPINERNAGHAAEDRWEIAENVPFQKSFEGCIEKYFPNSNPTLYAAVAYWYLAPREVPPHPGVEAQDPYLPVEVGQRVGYWVRPRTVHVAGAIEAEAMPVLNKPTHPPAIQDMRIFFQGGVWSNDQALFWPAGKDRERLELGFKSPAGRFHVLVRFTKAPDYGRVQVGIDGRQAGGPVDLYAPSVLAAAPVDVGTFDLAGGDHVLSLEVAGKNPASKGRLCGVDYIKLVAEK